MTAETFRDTYQIAGRELSPSALINQYLYVVKNAVRKICAAGPLPKDVGTEDLIQIGTIALCEAASRFDDTRGTRFDAFAAMRTLGAMRDHLRQLSWCPRSLTRRKRALEEAEHALIGKLERMPTPHEVAGHLGWKLEELELVSRSISMHTVLSLDYGNAASDVDGTTVNLCDSLADQEPGVEAAVALEALRDIIANCVQTRLDRQEQFVFQRRYVQQRPLNQIAGEMRLSQTRIAKISSNARQKVATMLREQHPELVFGCA